MLTFEKEFVESYSSLGDFAREDGCYRLYQYARQPAITVTAEADSTKEAFQKIESQLPEGYEIISRTLIADADPKAFCIVAESLEAAQHFLGAFIPAGSVIAEKRVLHTTEPKSYQLKALREKSAVLSAHAMLRQEIIGQGFKITRFIDSDPKEIRVIEPSKRGFLGIGSRVGLFEVKFNPVSVFEIVHRKPKAEVSARINRYDLYSSVRSPEDETALKSSGSVHDPKLVWQR